MRVKLTAWLLLGLLSLAGAQERAPATISLNLEDGAKVEGTVKLVARVQTERLVQRVEFFVDGSLREVDESTPYEFEWDTLSDTEGERTLRVVANIEGGQTASKEIKVVVDNGVDKGSAFHFQQAREAFIEGKFEDAVRSARIALKADSGNREARVLLIRAYLRLGRVQEADSAVDELVRLFPDQIETQEFRVATSLRRARAARNDRELVRNAIDAQHKINQMRLKAVADSTDPEAIAQRALLLIREGNTASAINDSLSLTQRDERNIRYLNLLAYAYLQAGRARDVIVITNSAIRRQVADDYTYAIRGVTAGLLLNDEREQENAFAQAEKIDKNSKWLLNARASLAISDLRSSTVARLTTQAQALSDNSPETAFVRYWALTLNRELDRAKDAFWRAVELDPLNAPAYTLRGLLNLSDGLKPGDEDLIPIGREWCEVALQANPNYAQAQMGIALSYAFEIYIAKRDGKQPEPELAQRAEEALNKALSMARDTAWAQFCAAYIYEELRKSREADQAIRRAAQIDPKRITNLAPPEPFPLLERIPALMFAPMMPAPM